MYLLPHPFPSPWWWVQPLYIHQSYSSIHPQRSHKPNNGQAKSTASLLYLLLLFFHDPALSLLSWMPKASPSSIQVLHPVYLFFIACLGLTGVQFKLLSMGWSHMQYFSSKFNFKGSDCSPSLWPFYRITSRELGALSFFYLGTTLLLEAWLCLTFPPAPYMVKFQYSGLVISASWFTLICAEIDSMDPFLLSFFTYQISGISISVIIRSMVA